jgi:signal transduction histidine kinase
MQVVLTVGQRKINVTADRQQIVELLISTYEQLHRQHDELAAAYRSLQQARADAERANQAKSQFLFRVSHELRTPLHAILGFAQLLGEAELAGDERQAVRMICSAGEHILNLINDLLDIGRIEEGELALTLEPVYAGALLRETTELMRPLAAERRVTLHLGDAEGTPPVLADRQRLRQILINLVANAVKYNVAGGAVTLRSRTARGNRARIEISDTGPGIPPDKLHRLFHPFDRLDADRTGTEGTGLGLALSQGLAAAMGGDLGVHSEPGLGSTFWVELAHAQPDPPGGHAGAFDERSA